MIQDLLHWLDRHGDRVLYVYGAQDPCTAAGVTLSGWTDALHLDVEGGNHSVGYADLSPGQPPFARPSPADSIRPSRAAPDPGRAPS